MRALCPATMIQCIWMTSRPADCELQIAGVQMDALVVDQCGNLLSEVYSIDMAIFSSRMLCSTLIKPPITGNQEKKLIALNGAHGLFKGGYFLVVNSNVNEEQWVQSANIQPRAISRLPR
jgi:hypothetical protein